MKLFISKILMLFAKIFSPLADASTEAVREIKPTGGIDTSKPSKFQSINNEYVLSAGYLQAEAYHGSFISNRFARLLLWSFISILITPILLILSQFRHSDYFWILAIGVISGIALLVSLFYKEEKEIEEKYTAAWEAKTRSVSQVIQDRIYVKDRNTKFRTTHLAEVHRLQSIPENQSPQSLSNMRPEMEEKFTAAMNDMTSETRVMLNIHLFASVASSNLFIWIVYYCFENSTSFQQATNYMLLLAKTVVLIVMYVSVLHQTKFWIDELERERRSIMRGWNIVN